VRVLGHCHGNPLGLGARGPGGDDLVDSWAVVQRSASTAAPQTYPWSCSVTIMVQMLRTVSFLELVTCNHLVSILLYFSTTIGDPVLGNEGPRVDDQLQLGVLLPVLTASTFSSSSTVSMSMFSMRLMVCAYLGDLVLELVGVIDLEVLSVGSKDDLVNRLNLGLLGSLPCQRSWRS
jgi:hypothetical protein